MLFKRLSVLFTAVLMGCSYYPSETENTGTTSAIGGSAGSSQGGNAQGGGGASQGGSAQGGGGSGQGGQVQTGGSGGAPPAFLTCNDVAANHAVMKVEVVGNVPGGVSRLAADGYNTKQVPGTWDVQYVGAVGATQVVKDWGVCLSGFKADTNWGFALDDTTKIVGDAAPVVESGTWLCRQGICEDANITPMKASFLGCYGTTQLGLISGTSGPNGGLTFPAEGDQANILLTVP